VGLPTTAVPRALTAAGIGEGSAITGATVLAVDDVETNLLVLEQLLLRAGAHRVVTVMDPREALDQFRAVSPDIVLLDLHMPYLDGTAVLEAVTAVVPEDDFVPVVVLTADTTFEARQRALALGAHDFLTKPFEQVEVLLRINNLLQTRRLHASVRQQNAELEAELRQQRERERRLIEERDHVRARIERVLRGGELDVVFQPIIELASGRLAGVEALSRFAGLPSRPPDLWFAEAATVGLRPEMELLAVRAAIAQIQLLPPDCYLSINVSPETALTPGLAEAIEGVAGRIVIEVTEHDAVAHYDELLAALQRVRVAGARIAVDDAGSGYASLQHILRLGPNIIKLDIELTRGVDRDPARRALALALVSFAAEIGATITAEGIESGEQLQALLAVGAAYGQGYHIATPLPVGSLSLLSLAREEWRVPPDDRQPLRSRP
jgi:EAL domain-containing protein (putative c-di-GMP-specific phosphodiesterase class I)